jgi:hypothetical protein
MTVRITWAPAHGGEALEGDTAEAVVRTLWRTAFLREPSAGAYMRAVAKRAEIMTGHTISTETAEDFLEDLEAARIITITKGA